jgi:type II secretory pathway pseudopilin PulG
MTLGSKALSRHIMSRGRVLRRCAGFSMFELIIATTIVGLLGTALAERMLRYQEYAEKVAMEVTARQIQTGLRMQVADLMMRDRLREAERLLEANPFTWLEALPPNYIGEKKNPTPSDAVRGTWYFDSLRRELVYTPLHRRFFQPLTPGSQTVRYRVSAVPVKSGQDGQRIEGLSLLLLSPYKWEIALRWDKI